MLKSNNNNTVVEIPSAGPQDWHSGSHGTDDSTPSSVSRIGSFRRTYGFSVTTTPKRETDNAELLHRHEQQLELLRPHKVDLDAAAQTLSALTLRFMNADTEAEYQVAHIRTFAPRLYGRLALGFFWLVATVGPMIEAMQNASSTTVLTSITCSIALIWYILLAAANRLLPEHHRIKFWDLIVILASTGYVIPIFAMLGVCVAEGVALTMADCTPAYGSAIPIFPTVLSLASPHFTVPLSGGTWYDAVIVASSNAVVVVFTLSESGESLAFVLAMVVMFSINIATASNIAYIMERSHRVGWWLSMVNQNGAKALAETEDMRRGAAARNDIFMTFATATGQMLYELDASDRFISMSATCKRLLGRDPTELVGNRHSFSVFPEDLEELETAIAQLRQPPEDTDTSSPIVAQFRRLHADGSLVWVEMVAVLRTQGSSPTIMASERNVGAERESREAIALERQRRVAASAAQAAQEEILGYACHELRNPLHVIQASLSLLSDVQLDEELKQHLHAVQDATRQMHTLVDDILDVERLRAGKLQISLSPACPNTIVKRLEVQHRDFAQVPIFVDIAPEVPSTVVLPADRVVQVLNNGLTNACKFCSTGAIRVRALMGSAPNTLRFEIRNSGTLPADRTLFRAFDSTPTRQSGGTAGLVKGTGLGLRISASLATAMGAQLHLENLPVVCRYPELPPCESETVFWLQVPFTSNDATALQHIPSHRSLQPVRSNNLGLHVLYVDDEPLNRRLGKAMLQKLGCTCDLLEDGDQVLDNHPESYDVILLDIVMQRVRGDQVVRMLSNAGIRTPCIAVSGNTDHASVQEYLRIGFRDTMGKPFTLDQMHEMLAPLASQRMGAVIL